MKSTLVVLFATLSPALILAAAAQGPVQAPSPAPSATQGPLPPARPMTQVGTPGNHTSRVAAVIYGPQGEVQALALRDGVAVTLPPDLGTRLQSTVSRGTRVQVSGMQQVIAGQTSLVAQSVTTSGQTFVAAQPNPDRGPGLDIAGPAPAAPPPPAGSNVPCGPRERRAPGAQTGAPPDGTTPPPPPPRAPVPPPPQIP
jgi:hypothetical protein